MTKTTTPAAVVTPIQGVGVRFTSDIDPLNTFAQTHFAESGQTMGVMPDRAGLEIRDRHIDIDAQVEWIEAIRPKARYDAVPAGKVRFDRDLEMGQGEMTWSRIDDFLDLQLRFELEEDRLRLRGQYFFSVTPFSRSNRLRRMWHRRRLPALREKRFSTILYYTMYYPAFWWLERRGLFPLHAAAVDVAGTGVVLYGLPGIGKSTLSLALLSLPNSRLLSDNIIFFDRNRVYRCPEPVLVDARSLDLMGGASAFLQPLGRRHVFDRDWCHVSQDHVAEQTTPRVFLFVGLGQQTQLRPLSYPEAAQRFAASNCIAKEVRRYLVYRSVLRLLGSETGKLDEEMSAVQSLLSDCQCYEFTVGWGEDVHKTLDHISGLLDQAG